MKRAKSDKKSAAPHLMHCDILFSQSVVPDEKLFKRIFLAVRSCLTPFRCQQQSIGCQPVTASPCWRGLTWEEGKDVFAEKVARGRQVRAPTLKLKRGKKKKKKQRAVVMSTDGTV